MRTHGIMRLKTFNFRRVHRHRMLMQPAAVAVAAADTKAENRNRLKMNTNNFVNEINVHLIHN